MTASWVKKLQASDSRLHKEEVLKQALAASKLGSYNAQVFLGLLKACYNPFVTFNVRQIEDTIGIVNAENPWQDFNTLLHKLSVRAITGNAAHEAIFEMSTRFDSDEWNNFCALVLRRDMRAGISDKTINKVCKNTEYEIPIFGCQLATNCEGRPEMRGIKRLEPKLDGCLSADWVVEFQDGTKVTIKEVVDKNLVGKVKSYNTITGKIEFNDIVGWSKDGVDDAVTDYEWFEITLENGKTLPPLTGNHLVYLPKLKCYRRVDLLTETDELLTDIYPSSKANMTSVKIKSIKKLQPTAMSRYDIQVKNTNNFFANDTLVHNCRVLMLVCPSDTGDLTVLSFSRNGKIFQNFSHIENQIADNANKITRKAATSNLTMGFVLDGEVIGNSFQELMRQARRKENVQADDSIFNVFDIIPLEEFRNGFWKTPLSKRTKILEDIKPVINDMNNVSLVNHINVDLDTSEGRDILNRYANDQVQAGFEGIMIKDLAAPYECKRNTYWMKYKPVHDYDLTVIGIEEGTGKHAGRMGALVCEGIDDGKHITVNVGSGYTDEERQSYWDNKNSVIGKTAVVLADAVTRNQNGTYSLRFPRFKTFRMDK